jgi:RNA polymerase sigma factor (sigma-70 family)
MDNQEYWTVLWHKTKDTIYYVYHKKVNRYYKENMNEDILAVSNIGWYQAVKTYKKEKATAPFYCYATFIIDQQYRQFLRKMKPERIGKSVRYEFLQDIKIPGSSSDMPNNSVDFCISNILEDEESELAFKDIELKDYINNKLELLKQELPDSYLYIVETVYNNRTYSSLSEEYNVTKSVISKAIKKGYEFLKQECTDDKYNINDF